MDFLPLQDFLKNAMLIQKVPNKDFFVIVKKSNFGSTKTSHIEKSKSIVLVL